MLQLASVGSLYFIALCQVTPTILKSCYLLSRTSNVRLLEANIDPESSTVSFVLSEFPVIPLWTYFISMDHPILCLICTLVIYLPPNGQLGFWKVMFQSFRCIQSHIVQKTLISLCFKSKEISHCSFFALLICMSGLIDGVIELFIFI